MSALRPTPPPTASRASTFYSGAVSNCGTALLAQDMPSAFGLMFANFTLDGDIAIIPHQYGGRCQRDV